MLEFNKVLSGTVELKINGRIINVKKLTIEDYLDFAEELKIDLLNKKRKEYIECCKLASSTPNPKDLMAIKVDEFDTSDTTAAVGNAFELIYKSLKKNNPDITKEELEGLGVLALNQITDIVMSDLKGPEVNQSGDPEAKNLV
jgi:hypothetical protein